MGNLSSIESVTKYEDYFILCKEKLCSLSVEKLKEVMEELDEEKKESVLGYLVKGGKIKNLLESTDEANPKIIRIMLSVLLILKM